MSVKKNKKIMLVAIIAAIAVFVVSALAAGASLSGYERLKSAGFKLLEDASSETSFYSNGMFWGNAVLHCDGVETAVWEQARLSDGERNFTREAVKINQTMIDGIDLLRFMSDSDEITYYDDDVVYTWRDNGAFSARENYWWWGNSRNPWDYNVNSMSYNNKMTDSEKLFIEAIADALIGDTRNYFIADGNTVSISLSGNQIPQLMQYAIAVLAENVYYENIRTFDNNTLLGTDARISYGLLVVELNDDDYAIGAQFSSEITSTVNGALRTYRFDFEFKSKGLGTTTLTKPEGNAYGRPILPSYEDDSATGVSYALGGAVA